MWRLSAFAVLLAMAATAPASDYAARTGMAALSETEMGAIEGQQGILVDIDLRNNVSASNTPIGCTAVVGTPNPCRFGLEFAARTGVWLMMKEFYGTLSLNDLRLDATFLPATNTGYWNSARFLAADNVTCLVAACNPNSDPAIKLTYPGADAQNTYTDFTSFMNIGRTWLEFDQASPAVSGYARDTTLNSVFGVRMSDSTALNASARMRFWGTGYVYGF